MKKQLLVALLCAFSCPIISYGQTTFADQYEKFKQQAFSRYEDFRDKCNQEYAEMLKHSWEWYQTMPAIEKPEEDKEIPPIIFDGDKDQERKDKRIIIDNVIELPNPEPQPQPISPVKPQLAELEVLSTNFFGTAIDITVPIERTVVDECTGENLSALWTTFSDGRFDAMIHDCLIIRDKLSLCDWAYLLMLSVIADEYYSGNRNSSIFLTSYLYCQSGYDMRLATTEKNGIVMLFSSQHNIYGMPYYIVDDTAYYAVGNLDESRICICDAEFHGSKPLSLEITKAMNLAYFPTETISRQGYYSSMLIGVTTNKNVIDFYETYPISEIGDNFVSRWATYANKPLDSMTASLLYSQLNSILTGADEVTIVDCLLNFVQTAFEYEYDDVVWGEDRAFFPEETLFYPYCDCEDRSIFFSRMVRDLVGLDVLLVYYPGHLATAVHFNESVKGDYILLNGKKFVVCDPTYIGAGIGLTMPGMDNESANVILLNNF